MLCMCLKGLITALFERFELLHLLRMMGVSVPSLHIESINSMIHFLYCINDHNQLQYIPRMLFYSCRGG